MKRLFALFLIVCLPVLVSCSGGSGSDRSDGRPDDTAIKYVGRQRLEGQLKDPGSLEIISERVERPGRNGGEAGYWCKYRAKNGFGGYVVDTYYVE